MFASPADLLDRLSALTLAQIAVPSDMQMPDAMALRTAMSGGNTSAYPAETMVTVNAAMSRINVAINDAQALMLSYGVADTATGLQVKRICVTIAMYYLRGSEYMTDEAQKAYDDAVIRLKAQARGEINIDTTPPSNTSADAVDIAGNAQRGIPTGGTANDWQFW